MMNIIFPGPKPLISDVRQSGSSPVLDLGVRKSRGEALMIACRGGGTTSWSSHVFSMASARRWAQMSVPMYG